MCVPKKTKYIYCKAFNMITNKNEAKIMEKAISSACFISTLQDIIQIKSGIIKLVNVNDYS